MPKKMAATAISAGIMIACLLSSPGPAAAWKVDSHVYAANLVLEEALSTLTLQEVLVTDSGVKARIKTELRRVFGNTYGGRSRIEAKASGPKLAGRFYKDNGNWGEFEFVLDPDGQAFKGRWRRLNVENDDWHACEGRRPEKTA